MTEHARRASRDVAAVLLSLAAVLVPALAGPVAAPVPKTPAAASATAPAPAPAPIKLDTVSVRRGDIEHTVAAAGKLQLHKWADTYAQIGGQVRDVMVAIGDTVKADQALLEIVPNQQPTKLESTRAQMARLQADLADQSAQRDFAQLQFQRQTQLKAQNATREDAFESSRMGLSSANARVDSINAQIRQVEANLKIDEDSRQHAQVLAPMAGTVVALNAHPGLQVGPGQGQAALLRIADQSKMTVQARVAEADVTRLRKGMQAQFSTPGYPGQHWSGKLRQVMPIPAEGTGEPGKDTFYNVLFDVNNPDQQLMSGMSTQVRFVVGQAQDTLLLPARALGTIDADGFYTVTVLDAGRKPSQRKIRAGLRNAQQVQVLSGLSAGEQVLVGKLPPLPPAAVALPSSTAAAKPAAAPAPVAAS